MSLKTPGLDVVLQQLQWRYATKKFDPDQKITAEVWQLLEQSLVLAPSSFGLQPWKFFVVQDSSIRATLLEHSWGQKQVVDASHLVVLTIRATIDAAYVDHYLARMAEVQGVAVENLQKFGDVVKGFITKPPYPLDMQEWAARQVYIALAQLMTVAAMVGVDTCPMEGINPAKYDEVLGLAELGFKTVVACPLGYRAADDKYASGPKVRFPASEVVGYI